MPETQEQTEPYYELHRNFPDRYRCRSARRLGVPAKTLVAYYAVAHDLASNAGTFGEFTTDVRAFEEAIGEPERFGTTVEDVSKDAELALVWRMLEKAGVVEIVSGQPEHPDGLAGLPSEFRVKVRGMAARPRKPSKSGAERQAAYRERKRREAEGVTGDVRDDAPSRVTHGDVTPSRDADPSIHPSILPSIQPAASRVRGGALTREGAAAHPASLQGQVESTRRDLGPELCRLASQIVDNAREKHQRTIALHTEQQDFMRPLARLVKEHGLDAVIVAAEKAVARGAWSVKLVEQIAGDEPTPVRAPARSVRRGKLDPALQEMFDAADPDAPSRAGAA